MRANLVLKVKARSNAAAAAAEVANKSPRLDAAMRRGTSSATNLLANSVALLVGRRTSMSADVARRITKAEVLPGAGPVSRGRVSFERPPARIYPKKAKALAFTIGGTKYVRRSVKGSRPYGLIRRAAGDRAVLQVIEQAYRKEVTTTL